MTDWKPEVGQKCWCGKCFWNINEYWDSMEDVDLGEYEFCPWCSYPLLDGHAEPPAPAERKLPQPWTTLRQLFLEYLSSCQLDYTLMAEDLGCLTQEWIDARPEPPAPALEPLEEEAVYALLMGRHVSDQWAREEAHAICARFGKPKAEPPAPAPEPLEEEAVLQVLRQEAEKEFGAHLRHVDRFARAICARFGKPPAPAGWDREELLAVLHEFGWAGSIADTLLSAYPTGPPPPAPDREKLVECISKELHRQWHAHAKDATHIAELADALLAANLAGGDERVREALAAADEDRRRLTHNWYESMRVNDSLRAEVARLEALLPTKEEWDALRRICLEARLMDVSGPIARAFLSRSLLAQAPEPEVTGE